MIFVASGFKGFSQKIANFFFEDIFLCDLAFIVLEPPCTITVKLEVSKDFSI